MTERIVPLEDLIAQVEQLATLPGVARRVIQVTNREDFSANNLSSVLATDTALTAKLLWLGNSAFYGYPRWITTVRDAVVLIGFRAVRSTAIVTTIMDVFPESKGGPVQHRPLRGHSVAAGVMGELLAKETSHDKPENTFTAGVLHDIGRLVMNQYEPETFGWAVWTAINDCIPLHEAEQQVFGYDHVTLSAPLAERWNFPQELCQAIAGHHDAEVADPQRQGLGFITAHANAIFHSRGLWCGLDREGRARSHGEPAEPATSERATLQQTVEERLGGVDGVRELVTAFLRSSRDRDPRWYSRLTAEALASSDQAIKDTRLDVESDESAA